MLIYFFPSKLQHHNIGTGSCTQISSDSSRMGDTVLDLPYGAPFPQETGKAQMTLTGPYLESAGSSDCSKAYRGSSTILFRFSNLLFPSNKQKTQALYIKIGKLQSTRSI